MNQRQFADEFDKNGRINFAVSKMELCIINYSIFIFNKSIEYKIKDGFLNFSIMILFSILNTLVSVVLSLITITIRNVIVFYQMHSSNIVLISTINDDNGNKFIVFGKS